MPEIPAVTVSETTTIITNLLNGTNYNIWVKPINENGTGGLSPMATGKPIGNMGAVNVTIGQSSKLELDWQAVSGADNYEVYHSTGLTIPITPS